MWYNADQDSFDYEEYEIEDEMCKTRSIDEHKGDEFAYTDEPVADGSWVEEYLQRQEEYTRETEELKL